MDSSYVFPSDLNDSHNPISMEASRTPIASTSQLPSPTLPSSPILPLQVTRKDLIEASIKQNNIKELQRLAAEPRGFESSEIRRTVWLVV